MPAAVWRAVWAYILILIACMSGMSDVPGKPMYIFALILWNIMCTLACYIVMPVHYMSLSFINRFLIIAIVRCTT